MKEFILKRPILFSLVINITNAVVTIISINHDFYYGVVVILLCYILNIMLISKSKDLNKYYIFSLSAIFIATMFIIVTLNKYIIFEFYKL